MMNVLELVTAIVADANRRPALKLMAFAWNRTVGLDVEGDWVRIEIRAGRGVVRPGPGPHHIAFSISRDTLNQMAAGTLTPLAARLAGRVQWSGPLADVVRFAGILTAALTSFAPAAAPAAYSRPQLRRT